MERGYTYINTLTTPKILNPKIRAICPLLRVCSDPTMLMLM